MSVIGNPAGQLYPTTKPIPRLRFQLIFWNSLPLNLHTTNFSAPLSHPPNSCNQDSFGWVGPPQRILGKFERRPGGTDGELLQVRRFQHARPSRHRPDVPDTEDFHDEGGARLCMGGWSSR